MFWKKKSLEEELFSPCDGKLINLEKVNDPVFSQKIMGDGYAIQPNSNEITAPVYGEITSIFPTKHAMSILTEKGIEVLVHVGIDTVELKGACFEVLVTKGQKVTPETKVMNVDLEYMKAHEKETDILVIFTNMDKIKNQSINYEGTIEHGEKVGLLHLK